jgi:hypothetical protein
MTKAKNTTSAEREKLSFQGHIPGVKAKTKPRTIPVADSYAILSCADEKCEDTNPSEGIWCPGVTILFMDKHGDVIATAHAPDREELMKSIQAESGTNSQEDSMKMFRVGYRRTMVGYAQVLAENEEDAFEQVRNGKGQPNPRFDEREMECDTGDCEVIYDVP